MGTKNKQLGILNLNIAEVKIENDQLILSGSNLSGITQVKLEKDGNTQTLSVESTSASSLVANGITAVTLNVGQVFNMILSTANAAATVPVIFSLNNNSVTGAQLAPMGALAGQVLKFNGTDWAPASLIDAQFFQGTWNPNTETIPDIGASNPGDYFVVSAAGIYPPVTGTSYAAGDWIISDDYNWTKLELSKTSVTSFNGRKGLVNLIPGDYPNLKSGAKIPGSNLNDLANVDITTVAPIVGDVLKFNGTNWIAGAGGAAVVGSAEITDLSITGADIAENTINPSKIYSASINSALYLRGDKTWANFAADVLNVPLSTYALDAMTKPTVTATDRIGPALGKIQKYLNDLNTDYISKTATSQVVSGTFSFTSPTSFLYTQLPSGASPTEVANVQYVNNYVGAAVSGLGGSAPVTLTTANGAAISGDTTLNVVSTSGYPSAGTLLVGSEAITYTGTTGTSFTGLTRGAYGTTAAAISNGATINNYLLLSKSTSGVTPKMVVTGAGNVGIGTTTPGSSLDVTGTISLTKSVSSGTYNPGASAAVYVSGTAQDGRAGYFYVQHTGTSTQTDPTQSGMMGVSSIVEQSSGSGGSTAAAYGVYSHIEPKMGNTMGNAYAFYGDIFSSGTPTNGYGLYLGTIAATNKWSIYANDSTAPSYFAGKVGIGTISPTAPLTVAGNIQLTSAGTQLTSAGTSLVLQQTGDTYGTTSLSLENRNGLNGALFQNYGLDLVDFGFLSSSGTQNNIRYEHRASDLINSGNTTGEIQFLYGTQGGAAGTRFLAFGPSASIFQNGNVGIGTTSPAAKLDVADTGTTTSAIIVPRAGAFTGTTVNGMLRYNSTSNLFEFYQNGAWVNYTTVSDARLKTNVVPVSSTQGLDIVNQLNPVFYDWDKNNPRTQSFGDKHQVGFIAQEVEKVLPEVVDVGEDSYRSVQYGKIVSVVVAAVKELYNKFMGLDAQQATQARQIANVEASKADKAVVDANKAESDAKIKKLEAENAALKARLEKIEKALNSK